MRSALIVSIVLLASCPGLAQKFDYATQTTGIAWKASACDAQGNIVAVGNFTDTIYLQGRKHASGIKNDCLIAKFDKTGQLIWSYSTGGAASESLTSVVTDTGSNIYVAGSYVYDIVDMFPKFAGIDLPKVRQNFFAAKFSREGVFQWLKCPPEEVMSAGLKLAVTDGGNVCMVGRFASKLQLGTKTVTAVSAPQSVFLAMMNAEGNVQWLSVIGRADTATYEHIDTDPHGNIYLGGSVNKPSWKIGTKVHHSKGGWDIIAAKFGIDGKYVDSWSWGSVGTDQMSGMGVDRAGRMTVMGRYGADILLDDQLLPATQPINNLLFRTTNGKVDWARKIFDSIGAGSYLSQHDPRGISAMAFPLYSPALIEGISLTPLQQDLLIVLVDEEGKFRWVMQARSLYSTTVGTLVADIEGGIHLFGGFNLSVQFGPFDLQGEPSKPGSYQARISTPSVVTLSPDGREYCPGDSVVVAFRSTGLSNVGFTAYLSDAIGAFDSATIIGVFDGNLDSTIKCAIPKSSLAGSGYRIRVEGPLNAIPYDNGPTFVVHDVPTLRIDARKPVDFCEGSTVPLVASGGMSYLWSTGDTSASVSIGEPGWHYVRAWNEFGCEAIDSIKLTKHPLPIASVEASGPTSFCQGGQVILTAKGGKSYLWSTGENTPSITVKQPGVYVATVTGSGDCIVLTEEIEVTVHPLPDKPTITQDSGTLISSSPDGNQWFVAGGSMLDTAQQFTPSKTGKYYVRVSDSNGCTSQSDFVEVVIEQNAVIAPQKILFRVSPNPADGFVDITFASSHSGMLEIVDVLGASVYRKEVVFFPMEHLRIPLHDLSAGVYYIRIESKGQIATRAVQKR